MTHETAPFLSMVLTPVDGRHMADWFHSIQDAVVRADCDYLPQSGGTEKVIGRVRVTRTHSAKDPNNSGQVVRVENATKEYSGIRLVDLCCEETRRHPHDHVYTIAFWR